MPRTHKYGMLAITLCGSLAVAAAAQQTPYPVAQNTAAPAQVAPDAGSGTVGQIPAPAITPAPAPIPGGNVAPMAVPVPDNGIPLTAPPPLTAQPTPAPQPFANTPGPVAAMPHVHVNPPATTAAGCGTAGCTSNGCGSVGCGTSTNGCGSNGCGCGSDACGQGRNNYRPIFGKLKPYNSSCNNDSLVDRIQAKFKGGLLGKMMNGKSCTQSNDCSSGGCFSGSCLSKLGSGSCLSGSCLSGLGNGSCFGKLGGCGLLGGNGCSLLSGSCLGGGCLGGGGDCNNGGCNAGGAFGAGACGFASLGNKGYPDSGWAQPASVPIIRNNAQYTNWWPQQWYGSPGFAATPYPMVYMPTDTTQLGFGYMQVPYWQRRAGSYPPVPDPAMYHTRTAPSPAPYGYPLLYQPVTLPPHSKAQRSRTGWMHGSTRPATNPRQQVAQRPQPAPRMSAEQMERARQYQAQRQQQARDYQAAMQRNAAINARPVSSSSPR